MKQDAETFKVREKDRKAIRRYITALEALEQFEEKLEQIGCRGITPNETRKFIDKLTKLLDRKRFSETIEEELEAARVDAEWFSERLGMPVVEQAEKAYLAMIDTVLEDD